jgi:hypothetical protein
VPRVDRVEEERPVYRVQRHSAEWRVNPRARRRPSRSARPLAIVDLDDRARHRFRCG